jgi:hypothetical protein
MGSCGQRLNLRRHDFQVRRHASLWRTRSESTSAGRLDCVRVARATAVVRKEKPAFDVWQIDLVMQQHSPNAPPQFIAMVSGQCNLSGRRKIASTRLLRLSPSCCNLECVDELASNLQFFGKAALPGLLCLECKCGYRDRPTCIRPSQCRFFMVRSRICSWVVSSCSRIH